MLGFAQHRGRRSWWTASYLNASLTGAVHDDVRETGYRNFAFKHGTGCIGAGRATSVRPPAARSVAVRSAKESIAKASDAVLVPELRFQASAVASGWNRTLRVTACGEAERRLRGMASSGWAVGGHRFLPDHGQRRLPSDGHDQGCLSTVPMDIPRSGQVAGRGHRQNVGVAKGNPFVTVRPVGSQRSGG